MKRTTPVPEIFIDLLKQPEKEKDIIRPDLFSMQMRLSCSALPEERPPMLRKFPIQLRPNVRIEVAEFRPGKAGGQIQLAKPPAGVVLFSVGILLRNRQGKHGSIRQNWAGTPAGSGVKSLAAQNKLHQKILLSLQLPYRETDPANALSRNSFSSQAISCCPMITYIARPFPSREGIFGDKTKILPANTDRQLTRYRREYWPCLRSSGMIRFNFPLFSMKTANSHDFRPILTVFQRQNLFSNKKPI